MNLPLELTNFLQPHQIKSDTESLKVFGKDWTTYYDIKASAIVFPESIEQVQKLVRWARHQKVGLVPSGGRTGLSGGACAINSEVVVSFDRMNKIKEFFPADPCVVVEAGVITETLQDFAKQNGLYYPVDFAARGSAQIGGNIATNAGGIKVVRYGLTRDWIIGLKVVTGTGEILELNKGLIKNATGYDLRHLFIGSEGTLGFVVEATIKLCAPPPPLKVLVMGVAGLDAVMKVFAEFKKHTHLTAFEMFSEKALTKVVENTGLPRPLDGSSEYYILAEVECPSESAENNALQAFEKSMEAGWVVDGTMSQSEVQAKNFWRLREDISESLAKYSPYKNDISVSISNVPSLVDDLDVLLQKAYPTWEVVWFGHIGDGNLHINILRPAAMSKEDFVKECRKVDEIIFSGVKKLGGAISAEHGVGLSKKSFLSYSRSAEEIVFMKGIKNLFDPDQIMNPGKLL
jgi:glycolate oxidase subunit GlcD